MQERIKNLLNESIKTKQNLSCKDIALIVTAIINAYKAGKKVLLCGNGGSAADAQHIAAELVGRFKKERTPLSAIALTTDTSILTAIGNDYGFDRVFERQIEALIDKGDVLICISTSGSSENIIKAAYKAKEKKATTIGLTGRDGGMLKDICDICIVVPSQDTPRIQEAHITIGHIICELVEEGLFE
jgi:D-sedoheptulose 7-phosphate isomerase